MTNDGRDVELVASTLGVVASGGRNLIAAIGIDRYIHWPRLTNAVGDAGGAAHLFSRLGFEQATQPLLDRQATGEAIHKLIADELAMLNPNDSLVLFYAGHGGTRTHQLGNQVVKTGYLIPVDASDSAATWIQLDGWLRAVSLLPPKHILVILDACHSGIALGPIIKWRDSGTWRDTPLSTLSSRRSRRIITSALDDQVALDSGPVYGHSLFTGCLIEALTHGLGQDGRRVTTGSELGLYVQRRVEAYPGSRQTPDFGTFDFDDRGELVIPLSSEPLGSTQTIENPLNDNVAVNPRSDLALDSGGQTLASAALTPGAQPTSRRAFPKRHRWITWRKITGICLVLGGSAIATWLLFGIYGASQPSASPTNISAGGNHSCLLLRTGAIACWGDNSSGELDVPAGQYTQVSSGSFHTCAIRNSSDVMCWGANPDKRASLSGKFIRVSAGGYHTCALATTGTVQCLGDNTVGQCDPPSGGYVDVGTGSYESCAVRTNHALVCWGGNFASGVALPEGAFKQVSVGLHYACALRTSGSIACWGANPAGQATPPDGTFSIVSAGDYHACALRANGSITCWGHNPDGRANAPDGIFTDVSAGGKHSCAIGRDGTVTCWGSDAEKQSTGVPIAMKTKS